MESPECLEITLPVVDAFLLSSSEYQDDPGTSMYQESNPPPPQGFGNIVLSKAVKRKILDIAIGESVSVSFITHLTLTYELKGVQLLETNHSEDSCPLAGLLI